MIMVETKLDEITEAKFVKRAPPLLQEHGVIRVGTGC